MPKEMEKKLRAEGMRKGLKGKDLDAYVYGTMRKLGWKPNNTKEKAMSDSTKTQTAVTEPKATVQSKPVTKAFSDAERFVGSGMGFADNDQRMADIFGGGAPAEEPMPEATTETPPAETTTPPPPPAEPVAPIETTPANPAQDRIDQIKSIVGAKEVDKGIKKEGDDLISRLEEFKKLLEDADKFISANNKGAGAFAEGEGAAASGSETKSA